VTIDDPEYAGSKKIKLSSTPIIKKTSPVIKISFANPQGKGTVVEIPPKVQTQCGSDSDTDDYEYLRLMGNKYDKGDIDSHDMGVYGHKKVTKSLKKARENRTAQSPIYEPETPRRTKHNKHKVKHKHRHRHSGTKQGRHKHKEYKSERSEIPVAMFPMPSPREGGTTPSSNSYGGYPGVLGLWPGQPIGMESPAATAVSPMRQDRPLYSSMISEQQSDDSENTLVPNSNDHGLVTILKPTCRGASMDSPVSRGTAENVLSSNTSNRVGNTDNSDSASNSDSSEYASQAPPNMDTVEQIRPLMMRIQTKYIKKVVLDDGRGIGVGDIVWGKIHGFPWWPGRVNTISISQKDNGVIISQQAHVSWFGSSTMSNMLCSDLYPFLEEFKLRFKKKKRGPYKIAIKQATMAAQALLGDDHPVYDLEGLDNL
jgi:hypothetical protein